MKKITDLSHIMPPVKYCIRLNCMEPRLTGKMVCTEHFKTESQKKAERQALIALESEAREFCLKVEELQREYGFRISIDFNYDFPPSLELRAEGSNTRIDWMGDE